MTKILACFACALNVVGLLSYMCGPTTLIELYRWMGWKRKALCLLAAVIVLPIISSMNIYLVLFLAVEYAVILFLCRNKKEKFEGAPLRGVIAVIFATAAELEISWLFYRQGVQQIPDARIQVICYLGMATVLCSLFILRECRRIRQGSKRQLIVALEIRSVENLVWLGLCVRGALFRSDYMIMTIWFVFTIFMCYLVFFILVYQMEERAVMEKRADIHVNSYEYYLHMEEEHLQVRKMYHEMKNQLMILENDTSAATGANAEQIKLFGEKLDALEQFYHTGFQSLDILLFDGRMKAEARGIEFEAVISEGCLSFMREEDVNVIFSNAIINAIEACDKISEGPKSIQIKAGKNLDDTLIYVKNTVDSMRQKGTLKTGKKNKRLHGIGMTSIQECVERYHGYVSIVEEDNTFQLAILFGGISKEK